MRLIKLKELFGAVHNIYHAAYSWLVEHNEHILEGESSKGIDVEFYSIHIPGTPTLLVVSMFTMAAVCEPGILKKRTPSPALKPPCAGVPPKPLLPPEASPVVH